jgi:hypothetical protein
LSPFLSIEPPSGDDAAFTPSLRCSQMMSMRSISEKAGTGPIAAIQRRSATVIRSAVGVVLFIYFLGSNAMAPVRPDFFGDPLVVFHREINRGMWRVVGPPITATRRFFGGSAEQKVPLRSTIAPSEDTAGERQS